MATTPKSKYAAACFFRRVPFFPSRFLEIRVFGSVLIRASWEPEAAENAVAQLLFRDRVKPFWLVCLRAVSADLVLAFSG